MSQWNLGDLFAAVAEAVPDREAVIDDGRRTTYGELDRRINAAAEVLADRGVRAGDRVGLLLRNRAAHIELLLAACKLGATPFNVHDRYTREELLTLLEDACPRVVAHEPDVARRLGYGGGRGAALLPVDEAYEAAVSPGSDAPPPRSGPVAPDHLILYTGGTTGRPRGVVWRHADLFFGALAPALAPAGGDEAPPGTCDEVVARARTNRLRVLPASPLHHGAAQWSALASLLSGGTVVLQQGFDAVSAWSAVEAESITTLVIVGDAFARPLCDALAREPERWELSSLLSIVSGGTLLSASVRQELLTRLPWIAVVDGYGASETGSVGRSVAWPGQTDPGTSRFAVDTGTVVMDPDWRPVRPGSGDIGVVAHRGPIPVGFHRDEQATARVFPVVDGVRWAVPGDLATVEADGRIRLLGRGSSSINSGGEKVSPEEVESVLKGHPDVYDALVLGVRDERWGERVVAVVQLRPDAEVGGAGLTDHCRGELADFKVPRQVVLVEAIERLSTGKPDLAWARAVADRSEWPGAGYRAP